MLTLAGGFGGGIDEILYCGVNVCSTSRPTERVGYVVRQCFVNFVLPYSKLMR